MTRRLTLKSEHLAELSTNELVSVVGAQAITQNQGICASLVPTQCCTGYYPTLNAPCNTN
jgi:hypothetical protein